MRQRNCGFSMKRLEQISMSIDGRITLSGSDKPQPASHRRAVQVVWGPSSTQWQIEPPLCISSQPPRMETTPSASPETQQWKVIKLWYTCLKRLKIDFFPISTFFLIKIMFVSFNFFNISRLNWNQGIKIHVFTANIVSTFEHTSSGTWIPFRYQKRKMEINNLMNIHSKILMSKKATYFAGKLKQSIGFMQGISYLWTLTKNQIILIYLS